MKVSLTPLEKLEHDQIRASLFRATLTACQDLLEVSRDLSVLTDDPEAEKELMLTDQAIIALANTLEKQFEISA